jgi:nicotinamidase/pyrazinamidase
MVSIQSIGMAATYAPSTALVVVDVQNDFADPAGSLFVQHGDEIISVVNDEIEAAVAADAFVVYTQDWHPPTTPHFVVDGGTWPVHCVRETWGAELHPSLNVNGPTVRKGTGGEDGYSGFSMQDTETGEVESTGLHELLQERSITDVVVVGLALDVCVKATALDAVRLGYGCRVVTAASAPVDLQPGDGELAVIEMANAGVLVA